MGDRLSEIEVFIETAERGSLTAAARALGISTTAASRRLAALEERLGACLLERTTRNMSLTDLGAAYLTEGRRLLGDLDALDAAVQSPRPPAAPLAVHLPAPLDLLLPELLTALPQPSVTLCAPSAADVVISVGPRDDTLRVLGPLRLGLFAAPGWLEAHGTPRAPAELSRGPWLLGADQEHLLLQGSDGTAEDVLLQAGRLRGASGGVRLAAACAGLGAVCLPVVLAEAALRAGLLRQVLPDRLVKRDLWVMAACAPGWAVEERTRALLGGLGARLSAEM